jgi:tRNA dimethylallyltransferase
VIEIIIYANIIFMKPKIIVVLGPTATGKSDIAVQIAKKFNGEIISADSRQVFKGMDLGSGKITKKEMLGIPHHLLDIANPKKKFSVVEYKELAEKAIEKIISMGKTPIICGGTGFYIDSIVKNITLPEVKLNQKLRNKLEKYSAEKLFGILKKLSPARAKNIDRKNKVRLIRAIEIAKSLGNVPEIIEGPKKYDFIIIGLDAKDNVLKERIEKRLLKRIKLGMINEVSRLHKQGVSWKRLESFGLEYRQTALFLQKKITKAEMIENLKREIWHFVKRQRTWFKRNKNIKWFEPKQILPIIKQVKISLNKKVC